ncbi:hypothetical protein FP744_10005704 [Trichoderma asperellum]
MAEKFFPVSGSRYRKFDTLYLDSDGNPPQRIYTLIDENGNTLFEDCNRELLRAILRNNDVDALAQYLTKYPEVTEKVSCYYALHTNNMQSPNERGFLLLNIACKNCRVNTVRFLFDEYPEYADIHARDEDNTSAILAAAGWSGWKIDEASRRDEIMHLLLDRGASAKDLSQWPSPEQVMVKVDQPRENVLTLAAPWAGPDLIRRLIDKGADPDEKTYTYNTADRAVVWKKEVNLGVTTLFVASIYWNVEVVEMLRRHHKSSGGVAELVSRRDSCGRLPLHWAAGGSKEGFHPNLMESPEFARRAVDTLKLLVDPSAVNAQDNDGETPLHYAAHSYGRLTSIYKGVFQYLLENGADASIQNHKGRTPFQFLCDRFNDGIPLDAATMSLLYTESEDLSHGDAKGNTSLHKMASQWDRVEAVKFLFDRGADVAIKNLKGNTALHEAAIGRFIPGYIPPEILRSEFDGMMKVLLEAEAGGDRVVNIKNTAGRTARETFEDLWIGSRRYTIRDREDPYSRGGFGGRGRQKSPIYALATSVHRGR